MISYIKGWLEAGIKIGINVMCRCLLWVVLFVCAIVVYSQTIPVSNSTTVTDKEKLYNQTLSRLENDTTLTRDMRDNLISVLDASSCTTALPYLVHYMAVTYSDMEYAEVISMSITHRRYSAYRAVKTIGLPAIQYIMDELRKSNTVPHILIKALYEIEGPEKAKGHIQQLIQEESHKNNPDKLLRLYQIAK